MPDFRCPGLFCGGVVTLFDGKNLHTDSWQKTRAVKEDAAPNSGQQKFIGPHLRHQHAARLIC